MEWRFVPKMKSDPYLAIALEEVLLEEVSIKEEPIIRFWEWESKAVTIGRGQRADAEVDLSLCRNRNINMVRRTSGGGAMYHAPENEIVYSIAVPREHFPTSIKKIYKEICESLVDILHDIGVKAQFVEPNSVFVDDKKISGSAQKVTSDAVLQHGTLLYSPDKEEMFSVLKRNNSQDRYVNSNMFPVTGISNLADISLSDLYRNMKNGFLDDKKHFTHSVTDQELEKAKGLVDKKYKKESWNLSP